MLYSAMNKRLLIRLICLILLVTLNVLYFVITEPSECSIMQIEELEDFQKIGNASEMSYVYSANYHSEKKTDEGTVTIVGGLKLNSTIVWSCEFYDIQKQLLDNFTTKAKLIALPYDTYYHKVAYSAHYIICNISCQPKSCPTFVSVIDQFSAGPKNLLHINYKKKDDGQREYSFVLCHQPIHDFYDGLKFAEWFEFYRLMGVEKFVFYNKSIGAKTSCLMKSYGKDLVKILPWSDPYGPENRNIIWNGQFIAYHDCIQRYKGVAKYLVVVDMDEMIMPASAVGNNYTEMIENLNKEINKSIPLSKVAGYSFRNGFFFTKWMAGESDDSAYFNIKGNPSAEKILRRLVTAKNIERAEKMEVHGDRSKMIILPEKVVEISGHIVPQKVDKSFTVIPIKPNIAYSHHYRKCTVDKMSYCNKNERIIDNTSRRFAKAIAIRVAERFDLIRETCNIKVSPNHILDFSVRLTKNQIPIVDKSF